MCTPSLFDENKSKKKIHKSSLKPRQVQDNIEFVGKFLQHKVTNRVDSDNSKQNFDNPDVVNLP